MVKEKGRTTVDPAGVFLSKTNKHIIETGNNLAIFFKIIENY